MPRIIETYYIFKKIPRLCISAAILLFLASTAFSQTPPQIVPQNAISTDTLSGVGTNEFVLRDKFGEVVDVELAECAAKSLALTRMASEMIDLGLETETVLEDSMSIVERKAMIIASAYDLILQEMAKRDVTGVVASVYNDITAQMENVITDVRPLVADPSPANKAQLEIEFTRLWMDLQFCEQALIISGPAQPFIGSSKPKSPKPVEEEPTNAWTISQSKSVMTEEPTVVLRLNSVESEKGVPGAKRSTTIILRCLENTTAAYFDFGGAFVADSGGYGEIDYRIDDQPKRVASMDESTDNRALGHFSGSRAIPFIKKIIGGNKMIIRFTPYNESPVHLSFDIRGLEHKIRPLREACHW